jgi:hypothetical protein
MRLPHDTVSFLKSDFMENINGQEKNRQDILLNEKGR